MRNKFQQFRSRRTDPSFVYSVAQVQERVLAHAHAGHSMAGSLFWCLTAAPYPDYDGFKVILQQPAARGPARKLSEAVSPKAKPGVVKWRDQEPPLAQQRSDSGSGIAQLPNGTRGSLSATETHEAQSGSREEQQAGRSIGEAGSSGLGLRRVSSATENNCSAAAAMFEARDLESVEEAVLLDAETVGQIVHHARLMQQLNRQETQRDCVVM